ncbi:MAG: hypothetical protein FWD14_01080 [Treponema sp.]|nr:hypothetical protein [Treponema sp.]
MNNFFSKNLFEENLSQRRRGAEDAELLFDIIPKTQEYERFQRNKKGLKRKKQELLPFFPLFLCVLCVSAPLRESLPTLPGKLYE